MPSITYDIRFADERHWRHDVRLPPEQLAMPEPPASGWTRLEFQRCAHCTLDPAVHPHCPLALALTEPVNGLSGIPSWTPVSVQVTTPERTISCDTTLQRAAGSLMGLLSALSGCPHTRALLPMATFHLPFSTSTETLFRVMGTYLTGQYLRTQQGLPADWDMQHLVDIYRDLHTVNNGLANRIRAAAESESSVNAIVLLDILASDMRASIEDREIELLPLFAHYLDDADNNP